MNKKHTTCRVDYVLSDWIATGYCDLYFSGENAEKYKEEWHNIEFKKYDEREKEIEEIDKELESLEKNLKEIDEQFHYIGNKILNMRKQLPFLKRLFKKDTEEIEEEKKIFCLLYNEQKSKTLKYNDLISYKETLEDDKFYSATETLVKAEKYLKKNGFRIINSSQSGSECETQIDIWEKEH